MEVELKEVDFRIISHNSTEEKWSQKGVGQQDGGISNKTNIKCLLSAQANQSDHKQISEYYEADPNHQAHNKIEHEGRNHYKHNPQEQQNVRPNWKT